MPSTLLWWPWILSSLPPTSPSLPPQPSITASLSPLLPPSLIPPHCYLCHYYGYHHRYNTVTQINTRSTINLNIIYSIYHLSLFSYKALAGLSTIGQEGLGDSYRCQSSYMGTQQQSSNRQWTHKETEGLSLLHEACLLWEEQQLDEWEGNHCWESSRRGDSRLIPEVGGRMPGAIQGINQSIQGVSDKVSYIGSYFPSFRQRTSCPVPLRWKAMIGWWEREKLPWWLGIGLSALLLNIDNFTEYQHQMRLPVAIVGQDSL